MARLPQPGSDNGTWGDILNDYLSQSHAADGSLKADSVGSAQLHDNTITSTQIQDGSITEPLLASDVQTKLNSVVRPTDSSTSGFGFVVDEDTMSSNSAAKVPTQQSVKAYVDAKSAYQIHYINEIDCGPGVHADAEDYRAAVEVSGNMARMIGYLSIDFGSSALTESTKLCTLPAGTWPVQGIQASWSMVMMGSNGDPNVYSAQSVYIAGDDLDELWMGPVGGSFTEPAGYYLYLFGLEWRLG